MIEKRRRREEIDTQLTAIIMRNIIRVRRLKKEFP